MNSTNKYKQQRVRREEEEEPVMEWKPKTAQPFKAGDKVNCHLLEIHFYIPRPAEVVDCIADKGYMSEWRVHVKDSEGRDRNIDSGHFSLAK